MLPSFILFIKALSRYGHFPTFVHSAQVGNHGCSYIHSCWLAGTLDCSTHFNHRMSVLQKDLLMHRIKRICSSWVFIHVFQYFIHHHHHNHQHLLCHWILLWGHLWKIFDSSDQLSTQTAHNIWNQCNSINETHHCEMKRKMIFLIFIWKKKLPFFHQNLNSLTSLQWISFIFNFEIWIYYTCDIMSTVVSDVTVAPQMSWQPTWPTHQTDDDWTGT